MRKFLCLSGCEKIQNLLLAGYQLNNQGSPEPASSNTAPLQSRSIISPSSFSSSSYSSFSHPALHAADSLSESCACLRCCCGSLLFTFFPLCKQPSSQTFSKSSVVWFPGCFVTLSLVPVCRPISSAFIVLLLFLLQQLCIGSSSITSGKKFSFSLKVGFAKIEPAVQSGNPQEEEKKEKKRTAPQNVCVFVSEGLDATGRCASPGCLPLNCCSSASDSEGDRHQRCCCFSLPH